MLCDRRRALALGVLLVASAPGYARPPSDPADPIRSLTAALAPQGGQSPSAAAVRSAIERSFDLEAIARAVLADKARSATPAQRSRFRAALTGRIVRDLRDRLPERRWSLDIVQTRAIRPGEWLVTSRVTVAKKGARTLAWRVRSAAIVDILGNGTSMVRMLHGEYDAALRRFGLDGVIERMEARERRGRN